MTSSKYKLIVEHYEKCFDTFGDTHKGVDWPKLEDVEIRYRIMYEVIRFTSFVKTRYSILDFGCGAGHFLDYLLRNGKLNKFDYSGLDISQKYLALCKQKYPSLEFIFKDIMVEELDRQYDFIIMNGVFTEKQQLTYDEMLDYFFTMIKKIFKSADCGISFNVMSKEVDWEREDLFHLPIDTLVKFITKNLSRNFIIRNDYGLYEYTTYIYK